MPDASQQPAESMWVMATEPNMKSTLFQFWSVSVRVCLVDFFSHYFCSIECWSTYCTYALSADVHRESLDIYPLPCDVCCVHLCQPHPSTSRTIRTNLFTIIRFDVGIERARREIDNSLLFLSIFFARRLEPKCTTYTMLKIFPVPIFVFFTFTCDFPLRLWKNINFDLHFHKSNDYVST